MVASTSSVLNYKLLWLFWYIYFAMHLDKQNECKKKSKQLIIIIWTTTSIVPCSRTCPLLQQARRTLKLILRIQTSTTSTVPYIRTCTLLPRAERTLKLTLWIQTRVSVHWLNARKENNRWIPNAIWEFISVVLRCPKFRWSIVRKVGKHIYELDSLGFPLSPLQQ
jgi:hypothetical protein